MIYKELKEDIIGLANQTFAETFEKIFRQYWHDGRFTANAAKNYNLSDVKNGRYQALIPTMLSPDQCMKYSNIIIQVVPSITQDEAKQLADQLHKSAVKPAGVIDSELIVIVALQRHGWTRGFKHVNSDKGGYLTSIFVAGDKGTTSANELWRKLLQKVILPFYEKRVYKFLEAFNLTQDEDYRRIRVTQLYYRGGSIIERLDLALGLFVKSMSHFVNWLNSKLSWFEQQFKALQVTRQAEKRALEHCKPLHLKLRIQSKRQIIMDLQKSLAAEERLYENLLNNRISAERELTAEEKIEEYYLKRLPVQVACHG